MTNATLLIVEDEGAIAVRLERILKGRGYTVLSVGSGEEALTLAEEKHPDLVLMDIRLDESDGILDGIETAQELRSRFEIPSIYLTAYADEEFLQRARQTEPYGYLVKPLQELTLYSTIEMALSKIQADARLKAMLQEREILVQEIHHRVKNNMYGISSLLNMMKYTIRDEQALHVLEEGEARIRAMAMVHQMLYKADDLTNISFQQYATKIIKHLFHSYGMSTNKIFPCVEMTDLILDIDIAVPCGLLVNELVSNSLKHAFPGDTTGQIRVALHELDEGYELIVSDTGVGLPEGFDIGDTDSLGLTLVVGWTRQLLGELHIERPESQGSKGTQFRVVFTRH